MSAPSPAPVSVGGRAQPASAPGPKLPVPKARTVKVKAHTRVVKPRQPRVTQQQPQVDPYAATVQNAVDLKYGPQLAAVDQNVRNAQYAQIRSSNWYHDYVNSLNANLAQQNAAATNLAAALNGYNPQAAQTGNPQGDALAQQAQQSQHFLGQAFAGQQGQLALNTANQFATGLIPGANLQNELVQQNLGNQIAQAQTQRGQLKSQAGEYGTQVKGQLQAQAQKESDAQTKLGIEQYLAGLSGQRTNATVQGINSLVNSRTQGEAIARGKLRLSKQQFGEKQSMDQFTRSVRTEANNLRQQGLNQSAAKNKQSAAEFFAKYGKTPEQATKMSPGQWSNYAKQHPQFSGFRNLNSGAGGVTSAFTATQIRSSKKSLREAIKTINAYGLGAADAGTLDIHGIKDPLLGKVALLWAHHKTIDTKTRNQFVQNYGFDPSKGF